MKRGHLLSAIQAYHHYVLEPLVELMRIQADPTKKDFYLKHVEIDLPESDIRTLTELYNVRNLEELSQRLDNAENIMALRLKSLS